LANPGAIIKIDLAKLDFKPCKVKQETGLPKKAALVDRFFVNTCFTLLMITEIYTAP
jgi:hypothetical protein